MDKKEKAEEFESYDETSPEKLHNADFNPGDDFQSGNSDVEYEENFEEQI